MPWDPAVYNQFKSERNKPFLDLAAHITEREGLKVLDLGCGTGELTQFLAKNLTKSQVLGIDSSPEMLKNAISSETLKFRNTRIEDQLHLEEKWDLIFANASLQWVDGHDVLFPLMISRLNEGGQLGIQMPCQEENVLNQILLELVQKERYSSVLNCWIRKSPVLSMDQYAHMLFRHASTDMIIYKKIYPLIANSHEELVGFISGSAMIPYMERMNDDLKKDFVLDYTDLVRKEFPVLPAFYPFKRLIIYASF